MKKIICLLLAVTILLALCACGAEKGDLQVGFARVDVTPEDPVPVSAGDSVTTVASSCGDAITVSCVALGVGEDIFLVYTMDYLTVCDDYTEPAEKQITEVTGIPADRILMNATHTHSGPAIDSDDDTMDPYRETFNAAALKAAQDAIADMSPAQVYGGAVETEGLIFVRHYQMDNGSFAGTNYGSFAGTIQDHAYQGDTQVQVVRFVREAEGKKDVVLISNPAHTTAVSTIEPELLSGDIAASTRDYVEQEADVHVAYFIGAAGDQEPFSQIPAEESAADYIAYGQRMGKYVVDLLPQLTAYAGGAPELDTRRFTGNTAKDGLERLEDAKKVQVIAGQHGIGAVETKAAVAQYGFGSIYQATEILARSTREDTQTMTLNVMSLGDIAFVFAPYEMFSESGKYIKENSPYAMTFVVSCSEDHQGYLPTETGFRVGGYETHVTIYAPGTAEAVAETYVKMLKDLKD